MKNLITTTAALVLATAIIGGAAHASSAVKDCDLITAARSNYKTCDTGSISSVEWAPSDRAEQINDDPAPEPEPEPDADE